MKELLQLQNICVEIKDHTIFENVNTNVQQGILLELLVKMVLENQLCCGY